MTLDFMAAYDRDPFAVAQPLQSLSRRSSFTAAELQTEEFPELTYVVDGVLTPGASILAGRPKVNKTWLSLELAMAVASGVPACGDWIAPMGDVLYLALEDNARRLQSRLKKLMPEGEWPGNLTFRTSARRLGSGFREDVEDWVSVNEHPALIVVDTYHFIRPARARVSYEGDYADSSAVTKIANECGAAILVIHHQRKAGGDDALDTISGTTGVAAGFDSILTLERASEGGFTLEGRGRDLPDFRYALDFNSEACRWSVLGDADTARIGDTRQRILDLLETATLGPTEVARALSIDLELAKKTLQRMFADGQIQKTKRGQYTGANAIVL